MGTSKIILIAFYFLFISCDNNNTRLITSADFSEIGQTSDSVILNGESYFGNAYDGGSEIRAYFILGRIARISTHIGFSNGYNFAEYVLNPSDDWRVHEKEYQFYYDLKSGQFNFDSTEIIFSGSYSFKGDSLISQVSVGHNRFENDELSPQTFWIQQKDSLLKFISKNLSGIQQ